MKTSIFVNSLSTFLFKSVLCITLPSTAFIVAGHERQARAIRGIPALTIVPLRGLPIGWGVLRLVIILRGHLHT